MDTHEIHTVTGAFGFSGKYITRRLLDSGIKVRTLTNSLKRENEFGDKIEIHSFNFDYPEKLAESLRETTVLYNTYWVRFNHSDFKHSVAVENTLRLFEAAKKAGVKRIVHTSITNPSENSPLEYFSGKARLEKALMESGISYCILRPAVLFGIEDILINNIAWMVRKLPVLGIFGDGNYKLQPIFVDDFAALAVEEGKKSENKIINAIGCETFTYKELIKEIVKITGEKPLIISVSPALGFWAASIIGKFVGDVIITKEEIKGLMSDLLYTESPPQGKTKLTEWAKENASILGVHYASELSRRKDRTKSYYIKTE
ncbi:MAG: NAD(P)H-binding protein [Bacteroidia bacterium]|nr:NAD(P)H-binding protein [Bacteroidia bacterium]